MLASCSNTPTTVENPKEVTTVELQQLAKKDSVTYKVVEKDETLYVISTKDYTVVKKLKNETGFVNGTVSFLIIIFIFVLIVLIVSK